MSFWEGLLVVFIIILIVYIMMPNASVGPGSQTSDTKDSGAIPSTTPPTASGPTPEVSALQENFEYFTQCKDPREAGKLNSMCSDGNFDYAKNEFGAPNLSYADWVASQAVDKQVIVNHREFVKDRIGERNTQNITGRTYAMGELESDQIFWQGIRGRPKAVPICNPTQLPDINYDWYATKSVFCSSSQ